MNYYLYTLICHVNFSCVALTIHVVYLFLASYSRSCISFRFWLFKSNVHHTVNIHNILCTIHPKHWTFEIKEGTKNDWKLSCASGVGNSIYQFVFLITDSVNMLVCPGSLYYFPRCKQSVISFKNQTCQTSYPLYDIYVFVSSTDNVNACAQITQPVL